MALVVLSVVEQRLDAVRAVLAGESVVEVAARYQVARSTVHRWIGRYLEGSVAGLADRSHRPRWCPHQVDPLVEAAVAEIRRKHPRWGSKRIRLELLRRLPPTWPEGVAPPAERTVNRILLRQGLAQPRPRKRPRSSYRRFERPAPMQLWGVDIVEGIWLVNEATGVLREAKVVTGVDDHSRFCVMAMVTERATSRAVCYAFAQALVKFGAPEEVLSDNGKQFTDRFGKGGEVMFDRICRKNGIRHRLTEPASPNQNGKVERFHGTVRPDFFDVTGPFPSIETAQSAVDAWVADYNDERPHQALDPQWPVTPAERFAPIPAEQRELLPLWLPPTIAPTHLVDHAHVLDHDPVADHGRAVDHDRAAGPQVPPQSAVVLGGMAEWPGGPIEFDLVVPPSGNMSVAGRQFWLGPVRAGLTVRFWADTDVIHLSIAEARVKSVISHLTVADLARLVATHGAVAAGPAPIPTRPHSWGDGEAVEVDRVISPAATFALGGHVLTASTLLAGRQVGIRIEPSVLLLFDLDTRELLRTQPNPLTEPQVLKLRGLRPAGPPPRPNLEPVTVQRLADPTGTICVAKQRIGCGRVFARQTLTVHVSDTTITIELGDGDNHIVRRTTTTAVTTIKSRPPRTATKT
jgi:transposase InsO family protein